MSTTDKRPALVEWVRAALRQLDETGGDRPWADASNNNEETGQ